MTPEAAWHELTVIGHLLEPDEHCEWATIECPGGEDCTCRFHEEGVNYRAYYNDSLVSARVCGVSVPQVLLPIVRVLDRVTGRYRS